MIYNVTESSNMGHWHLIVNIIALTTLSGKFTNPNYNFLLSTIRSCLNVDILSITLIVLLKISITNNTMGQC